MKKIDTLIQPSSWDEARAAFESLGIRATLREVRTFGHFTPKREVYRGSAYVQDLCPELELSAIVEDERVEATVAALARIGQKGELSISSVEGVVRLGESRAAAVAVSKVEQRSVAQPRPLFAAAAAR